MRIGINALYLLPGKVGGSEIYVRNLVKRLAADRGRNDYFIFINRESRGVFEKIAPGFHVIECAVNAVNRPARILWEQLVLPFQVRRLKLDVLLSCGLTSPFFCPVPSVVVIYDLQHVNQPQNFPRWYLFFLRAIIYLSAKTSRAVVTISENSRRDVIRHYHIRPERTAVTYMASDGSVFYRRAASEVEAVRAKYSLPPRFILYIASSLPHKNYRRLLLAFRKLKEADRDIKLVLIGARDYGQGVIAEGIKDLGLADDVVLLGWMPFEDIPLVYSAAELFVFPSLHEGFGIPVLEAFSTGVPVVCSRIEPITEVAGGAARLVDPYSVDDMAEGMREVLSDGALRERLIRDGLRRAKDFSWQKTAEGTLKFLKECVNGKGAR